MTRTQWAQHLRNIRILSDAWRNAADDGNEAWRIKSEANAIRIRKDAKMYMSIAKDLAEGK